MPLISCRRCGKAFIGVNKGRANVCSDCHAKLESVYARAHEYLRDNPNEKFDVKKLSEAINANSYDIQTLVEIGWLERDIQTYTTTAETRKQQANAFQIELDKLKEKNKRTSYGGEIYARNYESRRRFS